jgi:predicted AAA+ superfamily ATPase
MVDLKRAAYQKMLAWKGRSGRKTLEVSGARQVGKTYLVNKFADERSGREEDYQEISALYQTYRQIGGYPSVVLRYLSGASMKECQEELQEIIRLFTNEIDQVLFHGYRSYRLFPETDRMQGLGHRWDC